MSKFFDTFSVSGFVRPSMAATGPAPAAAPAAVPQYPPLPQVPTEYQDLVRSEVQKAAQALAMQQLHSQNQQNQQPPAQVPVTAQNFATLAPEFQAIIQQAVTKQVELEKAKLFDEAPLLVGTWKRVIQLVGLGIAAVLLWEGGKWVVSQIWPSDVTVVKSSTR